MRKLPLVMAVLLFLLSRMVFVAQAQTKADGSAKQQHVVSNSRKRAPSKSRKTTSKQNCLDVAGLWIGTIHDTKNGDYNVTMKISLKSDNGFEGTLTDVDKEGTSKHYLKGQYNEQQDQFIAKDIGVDKSDGSGGWFPTAVDLYTLSLVEDGKKLVGACRLSNSNESLWVSLSREDGQGTDTNKANASLPVTLTPPSSQRTIVTPGLTQSPPKSFSGNVISKDLDALTKLQQSMLELVNRDREAHGLQPLQFSDKLNAFAGNYATQMLHKNLCDQSNIEVKTLHDRAKEAGLDPSIAENTAWQDKSGRSDTQNLNTAEETLMSDSAKGRDNILSPGYNYVGIGIALSEIKMFVVQTFLASDPDHNFATSDDNSADTVSSAVLNHSPEFKFIANASPPGAEIDSIVPFDMEPSGRVPQSLDVPGSIAPAIPSIASLKVPLATKPNPAPSFASADMQSVSTTSQQRRIAVLPFSLKNATDDVGDVDVGAEVAKVLSMKIAQMLGWAPIDQNDVSALLQRQDTADLSGTDIGKLLGADAIITGTVQSFGFEINPSNTNNGVLAASYIPYVGGLFALARVANSNHNARYGHAKIDIDAKLVDVYSGNELSRLAATATSPKSVATLWGNSSVPISNFLSAPFATCAAGQVTFEAVDSICAQLTAVQAQVDALAINHVQGKVTDLDDDLICINTGKMHGLKVGDKLIVEQTSDDRKSYIGTVVLTDVTDQTSIGKLVDEKGLILTGDTVHVDVQNDASQSIGALSRSSTQ